MGALVERYREELRRTANPMLDRSTLTQARIGFDELLGSAYPPCEITLVADRDIGSRDDALPIRVYSSHAAVGPAVLFFHGGGFVLGSLDSHDGFCRHLADATRMLVISVGYALAPERPYPAAVESGYVAARWLMENHVSLRILPERVIVMGDSAGGYIAAKVAAAFPAFALQVLLYPALDFTASSSSHVSFASGYGLDQEVIAFCYECFLGGSASTVPPVLESAPLLSPPGIVIVAESDPLRDEGIAYAELLNRNGRGAALWNIPDTVHGFAAMPSLFPQAQILLQRLAVTLRNLLSNGAVDYTQIRANVPYQDALGA